jgi:hypothetical protein
MGYRDPAIPIEVDESDIDDDELFPLSPYYGPDDKCPKCGKGHLYWSDDHWDRHRRGQIAERRITEGVFCGPRQRLRLRWFPWPKYCKHPGTHIHQTCLMCGAKFVSLPLSQKPRK